MNRRVVGALLLLLVGVAGILGAYFMLPRLRDASMRTTSDAGGIKGKISIALDNWIGYFVLRSPEMKKELRRNGWTLVVEDDNADYARRMQRLKEGKIDFAVATVDSYILNAAGLGFPGAIITVIDESKGGDAIVARSEKVNGLDALKGKKDLRIAFTPNSPSHHLAKAASYHFNATELLPPPGGNRIETKGSEDALQKILAGDADVAVLWEPDVSRALSNPGVVKIIGTEDTEKLIVDILVVNRTFSKKNPELVKLFLAAYFKSLKQYQEDPDLLRKQVVEETGLSDKAVEPMLKGVKWVNLTQNCEQWFGIAAPGGYAEDGLANTIESTVKILVSSGDFSSSPIPDNDPYRLTYSAYLKDLQAGGITGFTKAAPGSAPFGPDHQAFPPLTDAQWSNLKPVGTLKVDPVIFQHGAADLDLLGKEVMDRAVDLLRHYPKFRVVVEGHTATRGDPEENHRLSQERADAVVRYLTVTHNIDPNRLKAKGLGGTRPLPQESGESLRAWQYRLPRVELVLVREEY
jgi:outer membrane protein OmpA-like peptidoglycan-associated protein/ABC-type nitrate/sulfonate/bicarbonate transport system substrate-binding protein